MGVGVIKRDFQMTPVPVICFIGPSNSGKTTLMEKVIRVLTTRGYKVAVIKHTHKEFRMDIEGKDSWRHKSAGAKTVVISSATQFAIISDTENELTIADVLERFVQDVDILIVEGYKKDTYPKIEVHRGGDVGELRCLSDPSVIALASDNSPDLHIPRFDINDVDGVSNFIIQRFLYYNTFNNKGGIIK